MDRPRAAGRAAEEALLRELAQVYERAERLFEHHDCPRSTECCRFALTGREPYVTTVEVAAIERALAARGGPLPARRRARALDPNPNRPDEGICPLLQQDGRCAVYAARPFGCRSFWCRRARSYGSVAHREVQALVRAIQGIAARHQPGGDSGRPLRKALGPRFARRR